MNPPHYALITPVRNESKYIGHTIESVIAQTLRPVRWVIVSDNSTDATDDIVRGYAAEHPFIVLARRDADTGREFGSKVRAIELGMTHLAGLAYDYIGNLDGDVSFAPDYFAELLGHMESAPELGIAGGVICEIASGDWTPQLISAGSSVAGAVQMFRRRCYEQIGGYRPLPFGGVDAVAEGMARMHGWRVQTFTDLPVKHYRPVGTEGKSILRARFNLGRREYVIGYHPAFAGARALRQMLEYPYVLGGMLYAAGYVAALTRRIPIAVPADYARFLRREQIHRLIGRG